MPDKMPRGVPAGWDSPAVPAFGPPTPGRLQVSAEARRLHNEGFVVDLHAHGAGFVPQPFRALLGAVNPRRPREAGLGELARAGVDLTVVKAVGDPIVTRCYVGRSPWDAVERQLALVERQAARAGVRVVDSVAAAERARHDGHPAVLLGVEGADALDGDVDGVDAWHDRGVRVVVPVHLRDNDIGTTCLPWQQYAGRVPVRRRTSPGLTAFGARVIRRLNELGVLVDVAHADRPTALAIVDHATAPVVSSHSGARAVQDFARYLDDDQLRAIAATGGVVGLWPYRAHRRGTRTVADVIDHARHIAGVVGPEHLTIGTDTNGVPGLAAGYRGPGDLVALTSALLDGGFTPAEVQGIIGGNARRVLRAVETAA